MSTRNYTCSTNKSYNNIFVKIRKEKKKEIYTDKKTRKRNEYYFMINEEIF